MLLPVTLAAAVLAGSLQTLGATEALRPAPPTAAETAAAMVPAATPRPGATAVAAEGAPRMICTSTPVTGSRFPIRRCRTAAQVEADRVESADMLRRMQGARTPPVG